MKDYNICLVEDKKNHRVLMVKNLRGSNRGGYNFPGGKIEADEYLDDAVPREVREETGIKIGKFESRGRFYVLGETFQDCLSVFVYYSDDFEGQLAGHKGETKAFWADRDKIPYHKMRAHDREWVEAVLNGKKIYKRFSQDSQTKKTVCEDIKDLIEERQYIHFTKMNHNSIADFINKRGVGNPQK